MYDKIMNDGFDDAMCHMYYNLLECVSKSSFLTSHRDPYISIL